MNAPEKLYISKNIYSTFVYRVPNPDDKTEVEYIRADALIEKAIKYIANHFLAPGMDNEINDFKNYMKEEFDCIIPNNIQITIGTKIRSKANPDIILSIISDDCHEDEFECSNGTVLSLKQIEKYYDII